MGHEGQARLMATSPLVMRVLGEGSGLTSYHKELKTINSKGGWTVGSLNPEQFLKPGTVSTELPWESQGNSIFEVNLLADS